jgi:hypothetical protein
MPGAPARPVEVRHVPAGGISVFATPDASLAPIAELPSGFEVNVVGRRPPWVHIQAGDGLDGWVDGTALAGIAVGAHQVEPSTVEVTDATPFVAKVRHTVVEKKRGSFLLALGPALGALGGLIAILGAALPWIQAINGPDDANAFKIGARILTGWDQVAQGDWKLGWVIVVIAGVGALISMISGGGIVRRILGLLIVLIAVIFVLQSQDFLTSRDAGLGTGTNVWDLVDYGVLVTFGGGLLMLFSPSR